MNDLPAKAKRKRKLGVAPTKPQFVPGCTHFAPKCTQCKTKGLLQNVRRGLYHFSSHFTAQGTVRVHLHGVLFCIRQET